MDSLLTVLAVSVIAVCVASNFVRLIPAVRRIRSRQARRSLGN